MFLLNTTMLREKFIVSEAAAGEPMIALGNRIALPLVANSGAYEERFVIRGHNMHTTVRMAAMIARTFFRDGPILSRSPSYSWGPNWDVTVPTYEKDNNPQSWVVVYFAGRVVFKQGEPHPFMDVIEQCDARNREEYDRALRIAEQAFSMAGRTVSIKQDSTIAMVIGAMADKTRIGLMFRNPRRSTTFNLVIEPKKNIVAKDIVMAEPYQCLNLAANWLELVQLSVTAGFYRAKKATSRDFVPKLEKVQRRLGRLNEEIEQFEEIYAVSYRPERPNMLELIEESAAFARGDYVAPE